MLRRNVGRGKDVLEGLEVRWAFVANLLQVLCAFPRNCYGPWRLGGSEKEPMHKYYDPRLFHMMGEDELKLNFAPKEVGGVVLKPAEVEKLDLKDRLASAVDLSTPQQYIAAGFDVNFVGPQDLAAGVGVGAPLGDGVGGAPGGEASNILYVDEQTFCTWFDRTEFTVGLQVQKWWAGLVACEEDGVDALKMADDEATVDLYGRIVSSLKESEKGVGGGRSEARKDGVRDGVAKTSEPRGVKESVVPVSALVEWLQGQMGLG